MGQATGSCQNKETQRLRQTFSKMLLDYTNDPMMVQKHTDFLFSPSNEEKPIRVTIFSESCPSSHKYAYRNGEYCCRTNKEKNDSADGRGDLCDGSEIGIDSRCCENDDFAGCENGKCVNHKDAIANNQGNKIKK